LSRPAAASMPVTVVLGAQWGDEGKGKLVDILAQTSDLVVRYNGGSNAGHTIVCEGRKFDFHMLPSGMLIQACTNVLGNGVVLHTPTLFQELDKTCAAFPTWDCASRVKVSDRAHLLFDFHQLIDGLNEAQMEKDQGAGNNIGTTKKGIGPCYSDKASRVNLRVCDLRDWDKFTAKYRRLLDLEKKKHGNFEYDGEQELERYKQYRERLMPMVVDTVFFLNQCVAQGKNILLEGANATLLDLDFGTYPFVTSSSPSVGGVCTGCGLSPEKLTQRLGVVKAYSTRVGSGPFPTEDLGGVGEQLRATGGEFGVTTGRPRRCGWLDIVSVRYTHMLNAFTALNITKLDVLSAIPVIRIGVAYKHKDLGTLASFPADLDILGECEVEYEDHEGWMCDISKVTSWEALPELARKYVSRIEELVGCPVRWVGVGPDRSNMLEKPMP